MEVAYNTRLRVPSDPEYHILYKAPSRITYGWRTPVLSADPAGPTSRKIPWRVHVEFVRASARSPEERTSTFARWPARKSASELWVQVIPRTECVRNGAISRTSDTARRIPRRAISTTLVQGSRTSRTAGRPDGPARNIFAAPIHASSPAHSPLPSPAKWAIKVPSDHPTVTGSLRFDGKLFTADGGMRTRPCRGSRASPSTIRIM